MALNLKTNTKKMKATESQNKRLAKYLRDGGKVNPLTAWEKLGIYRLSARIFDIKKLGLDVKGDLVEVLNRFGETTRVKEYWIEKK